MGYRVYLDSKFNPVPPARASLVKVVKDDGTVSFYRPKQQNQQNQQKMNPWHDRRGRFDRPAYVKGWLEIGKRLGVDFKRIKPQEWIAGCNHELEHSQTVHGDKTTIAKIALDHLKEDPTYYQKLQRVEAE